MLERVRALALVRGWRGVEQTPETAFVARRRALRLPGGRAVHLVRDGRDVACSLLERGWLSAGRTRRRRAKLAYGARARFWVEPDAGRRVRGGQRRDARGLGLAALRHRGALGRRPRVLELRYEAIAADPPAAAADAAASTWTATRPRSSRASGASPTARSAATAATCRPSNSPTSSGGRAAARRAGLRAESLISFSKGVLRPRSLTSDRQLRHRTTRKVVNMRRTLIPRDGRVDGCGARGRPRRLGPCAARPRLRAASTAFRAGGFGPGGLLGGGGMMFGGPGSLRHARVRDGGRPGGPGGGGVLTSDVLTPAAATSSASRSRLSRRT